jgi:sulfatase-like protein
MRRLAVLLIVALAALWLASPAAARRPHAVVLVFDELPVDSLMGPGDRIDAGRFPGFDALARRSTWYRDATTVHDMSVGAVPAILDGRVPRSIAPVPTYRRHPHNLFRLLAHNGYGLHVVEEISSLCPYAPCRRRRTTGRGFFANIERGRAERIEHTIDSIRPRRRPTLWFHHTLLPHTPWVYLPDGRRDAETIDDIYADFQGPAGFHDVALTHDNRKRHLRQVGYVDSLVKRLLDRLRATGMDDDTAVVVVADHGQSWELGVPDRRGVTKRNIDEIAPVPLFIAAPGQRSGRSSRALVRITDVLPTLARILRIRIPWRIDGRPAGSRAVRARHAIRMLSRDSKRTFRISRRELGRRRRANVRRWLAGFGHGTWDSLFSAGVPRAELLGRNPYSLPSAAPGGLSVRLRPEADRLRNYDRDQRVVPVWIAGEIKGGDPGATRDVAAALNGRIVATGRSFRLMGSPNERFSLLYPDRHLRPGANTLELYEVLPSAALRPLGGIR